MLLRLRPPLMVVLRAQSRLFHASACLRHLVAPPDAISHMRPIIYEDVSTSTSTDPSTSSPPTLLRHPYSLSEFSNTKGNDRASDLELQFRLQRQQLDAFHHNFWFDVSPAQFNQANTQVDFFYLHRATHGSKRPNKPSSRLSRKAQRLLIKRMFCRNSINNGSCKRKPGQMPIPQNGVVVTLPLLSSRPAFAIRNSLPVLVVYFHRHRAINKTMHVLQSRAREV